MEVRIVIGVLLGAVGGGALVGFFGYMREIKQRLAKLERMPKRNPYHVNDGLEELKAHKNYIDFSVHVFSEHVESMRRELEMMQESSKKYDDDHKTLREGKTLE